MSPLRIPLQCSPWLLAAVFGMLSWLPPGSLHGEEPNAWARHAVDNAYQGADGTRLADFNGDGLPDIVTGWEESGLVRLYLHPGHGHGADGARLVTQPWPAVTVVEAGSPEDAVPVDLDGDGRVDIVSSHEGKTRQLIVAWNDVDDPTDNDALLDAKNWRVDWFQQLDGQMWMFALPIELGNDSTSGNGRQGLVVGSKGNNASITLLIAPSENARVLSDWQAIPLRAAGWIMSLEAVDMNGDGRPDVVYSDRKGAGRGVGWLEQPAEPSGGWVDHRIGGEEYEVMFLDASPRRVLVATRNAAWLEFLRARERDGASHPWRMTTRPNPPGVEYGKAIRRLEANSSDRGRLVMTANTAAANVDHSGIWISDGGDGWRAIDPTMRVKPDLITLVDLDGDGDVDILTCEERRNLGIIWYENPGRH